MKYRYKAAHDILSKAKRVVVVSHQKPDGDTLGAAASVLNWCKNEGIDVHGFCHDVVPEQYRYLPGTEHFTDDPDIFHAEGPADVVAVFDAGDLEFAMVHEHIGAMKKPPQIVNFDHHVTNERFGHVNVVDVTASSTTEVVYEYLKSHGAKVDRDIAKCLLTGIITDTGGFSNPATTVNSLNVASDLIRRGAKIQEVSRMLMRNKPLPALRLWGTVFERLKFHDDLGIASTVVFLKDLEGDEEIDQEHVEGISNFLNKFLDVHVVLVLTELPGGKVKGSLRTASETDVANVAMLMGGGGHKKASGFTCEGRIEEDRYCWKIV